uniref:CHCH domain-containing protein n=1 Tax=Steinernema glaseri TaxID=37863 RepID=A0A1I7YGB2_9BILA
MGERYMPSIFTECDQLKQTYDRCFTDFFQRYISGSNEHRMNPCEQLHRAYKDCVEKNLVQNKLYEIDIEELRKEVLNTERDRLQGDFKKN